MANPNKPSADTGEDTASPSATAKSAQDLVALRKGAPQAQASQHGRFRLVPVRSTEDQKAFLRAGIDPYRGDQQWIRPLDKDIQGVFDRKKNRFFRHGDAERWLLQDDQGTVIGRTAAMVNDKTARKGDFPCGGMGFFECVNDADAAKALFDTAKAWNAERGMEAMDGPVNFGERQQFWGLLVDGFSPPAYQMNYNPRFYRELFEGYGFQRYFEQYTYGMKVHDERPAKYYKSSEVITSDPDYTFRHVEMDKLDQYAEDFRQIFNEAFASMHGGREMSPAAAKKVMQSMKPVIVDYIMWFGYHKERPIAFFINIPDINQYFKHVNGKMDLLGKMKFLWHSRIHRTVKKFIGIVFGVVPDYQGKGVEGAIIIAGHNRIAPTMKWFDIELQWIGDFNPKMMRVADNLGANITKTHYTYRYLFDRNRPFERHPIFH